MFYNAPHLNGDLSKWDVSRVTDMSFMFSDASSFNGDLSKWDVSKVTFMIDMFYNAFSFKGDLSKWNVSKLLPREGENMFYGDSCSLCDHVPHGLQGVCQDSCHHPSPRDCVKAFSKNQCGSLTQCTWCDSKDRLHGLCFSKVKTPQSGWICAGDGFAAADLARTTRLVQ